MSLRELFILGGVLIPVRFIWQQVAAIKSQAGCQQGCRDAVDRLVAADVVGHIAGTTLHGAETLKQRVDSLYATYSEPEFVVEDEITEGDKVLVRWTFRGRHSGEFMGVEPSGKQVNVTGMNLFRLAGDKIAEIWLNADDLGEMQQLGAFPR